MSRLNSIQDGGALVVNILVFDLRVQLQHCTYQRKALLFALIKVSTFICKKEILGCSSPLRFLQFPTTSIFEDTIYEWNKKYFLVYYKSFCLSSKILSTLFIVDRLFFTLNIQIYSSFAIHLLKHFLLLPCPK